MNIWFDADNGPHVLIMRPLLDELVRRGHRVTVTARDRTSTCELLDLYGIPHLKVGGQYGRGMSGKVAGTLGRAVALVRAMRGRQASVSFGHGSRALPLAARILGVPTVTMYDYEWVNPRLFNWFCRRILLPEVITAERCAAAGIDTGKVLGYPGFKEELYLGGGRFDDSVAADLGLRDAAVKVLLRPPATTAHYHNPEAEVILDAILEQLAAADDVQLVFLARTPDQLTLPGRKGVAEVIVPQKVYDGPSLVAAMDLVISGGGTMTREAALLGVPSYSFFRGTSGMVDEALAAAGKLTLVGRADQVAERLRVERRDGPVTRPAPDRLVRFICDALEAAAEES